MDTLHQRIHQGGYRPTPARRVVIPKEDGSERTLGILCLEDKVIQQAVGDVLSRVYEVTSVASRTGSALVARNMMGWMP